MMASMAIAGSPLLSVFRPAGFTAASAFQQHMRPCGPLRRALAGQRSS
jgi:hypothetical protein